MYMCMSGPSLLTESTDSMISTISKIRKYLQFLIIILRDESAAMGMYMCAAASVFKPRFGVHYGISRAERLLRYVSNQVQN